MANFNVYRFSSKRYYVWSPEGYLWKDFTIQEFTFKTGTVETAPGYYKSEVLAKAYLAVYIDRLEKETKMGRNYVKIDGREIELSDQTVKNLKKELGITESDKVIESLTISTTTSLSMPVKLHLTGSPRCFTKEEVVKIIKELQARLDSI